MTRLSIRYRTPAELIADHDEQMARGGLLCRGAASPVGAALALFQAVELEIAADFGVLVEPEVIAGQVVQIVAGAGVAVAFTVTPRLADAVRTARGGPTSGQPNQPVAARSSTAEKIQRALHGTKDERGAIIRDGNRLLHPYVLKNPNLGIDEVLAIAKMRTVSAEVLLQICDRREWIQRQDIAIALVRNPLTPLAAAVKLLDHVTQGDLRQLAKDTHTRGPIQQAARKKVMGS